MLLLWSRGECSYFCFRSCSASVFFPHLHAWFLLSLKNVVSFIIWLLLDLYRLFHSFLFLSCSFVSFYNLCPYFVLFLFAWDTRLNCSFESFLHLGFRHLLLGTFLLLLDCFVCVKEVLCHTSLISNVPRHIYFPILISLQTYWFFKIII